MALTIEINHAKTRANGGRRGIRSTRHAPVRQGTDPADQVVVLLADALDLLASRRSFAGTVAPTRRIRRLLLDFAHGRLYFFFVEIWPQDLYLGHGSSRFWASTVLILTNALAGRLWCGFACPQTVWTDLFLLVERLHRGRQALSV